MALPNGPQGGGAVTSVFGRTGAVVAAANDYTFAQIAAAAGAIALSNLVDPGSGKVIGSLGAGAVPVIPPGARLAFTALTGNVSVSATSEAAGTSVGSLGAVTYDGTAVRFRFFSAAIQPAVADGVTICIFDGATEVGRITRLLNVAPATVQVQTAAAGETIITPSAGAHTYTFTAFVTTSAGTIVAGAGGTGVAVNGFIEATKV